MSKTFSSKSTNILMSLSSICLFYRVFGCFSAMAVQTHDDDSTTTKLLQNGRVEKLFKSIYKTIDKTIQNRFFLSVFAIFLIALLGVSRRGELGKKINKNIYLHRSTFGLWPVTRPRRPRPLKSGVASQASSLATTTPKIQNLMFYALSTDQKFNGFRPYPVPLRGCWGCVASPRSCEHLQARLHPPPRGGRMERPRVLRASLRPPPGVAPTAQPPLLATGPPPTVFHLSQPHLALLSAVELSPSIIDRKQPRKASRPLKQ
jgi:hypothetical protein